MIDVSEDADLAYALSLQAELDLEQENEASTHNLLVPSNSRKNTISRPVSVVDESWELIDPIPDIRQLFLQFNDAYFKGILASVEVKWSPRMTLCAGLCCYEGRGGLCSIRLSSPLLKLRPRKDLVQTLLHEMIHALLFVTQNNKDHDSHGPEFHKHMHRINAESGANITVYHNFHDEVNVYRQHWWQCSGPCRRRPPYYGIVRRAMNRAPSPRDTWWTDHQRTCGGTYTKIKEPENYGAKKSGKAKQGRSEIEAGATKTKGHVLGGGNSGTLPRFFKRKTRDSDDNSSNSEHDQEMVKRKKKSLGGDSDVALSVHNEDMKSKVHQRGSSRWTADVIPFSGPGRTLGSSSDDQNYKTGTFSNQKDSKTSTTESKKPAFIEIKTPSPSKTKTSSSPTFTIVDAFQRAKDKNKSCKSSNNNVTRPVLGSQQKPIELTADSPGSSVREGKSSHSDHSNSSDTVQCPVCRTLISNSKINQHLDSCLQ